MAYTVCTLLCKAGQGWGGGQGWYGKISISPDETHSVEREEYKMAASHVEVILNTNPCSKETSLRLKSAHREKDHIQQDERLFSNVGGAFTYKNQKKLKPEEIYDKEIK